jgi:hypothetical protein
MPPTLTNREVIIMTLILEYIVAAKIDGVAQAKIHWAEGSDQVYECLVGIVKSRSIVSLMELDSIVDIVLTEEDRASIHDYMPGDLDVFQLHDEMPTWQ